MLSTLKILRIISDKVFILFPDRFAFDQHVLSNAEYQEEALVAVGGLPFLTFLLSSSSCSSWPSWEQWPVPTPQAGPAPPQPSWAGTAGPRAPARIAFCAAAPRRNPLLLLLITAPAPRGRKRRRMAAFCSTLTGRVSPSRPPPGRGCGHMWPLCTPRARRWWTGYGTQRTLPR